MAPDTRPDREARHDATEPATSAGSHDTVGRTTMSFGPPKEATVASVWSDISGMSYISPANVGFEPAAPYERPMAPTPGASPSPRIAPAPANPNFLLSDLLPSEAPSSCDFGTPKNFFARSPVFGPSPPFVPKTRGRAAFQARCETASPASDTWSRFLRDFTTPDLCDQPALEEVVPTVALTPNLPTTYEPATPEQAHTSEPATTEQAYASEPVTTEQAYASDPATTEQAPIDAFTTWSLYAIPGNLLADFVSGILKFSQLDKDGNPVFVKDTDTNTSSQKQSSNSHKDVNAVHVSQEETRIFVSMDQLRKEIAELQEHDEAMVREADKAHQEKARLELQLQEVRGTCRKASSDSAIGSDSDDDIRKRAQAEKLKRMQKRLDEANTLANSQHVHIDALTAERDELIKECHLAHEHKKVLSEQNQVLNKENQTMKSQIQQAGTYFTSIEHEVKHLNVENERLRKQISQMYQQNDTLRKTRKSHSEQIKNLQTELEATRAQLEDTTKEKQSLHDENIVAQEELLCLEDELETTRGKLTNVEQDNEVLRENSTHVQAQSEHIRGLEAELEQTRTQLRESTQDINILVHRNKEMRTNSEDMKRLRNDLEDTHGRLAEACREIQALEREKKEIKAQHDNVERLYESLQESYTVIHRKLRDESTVNSVSSTGSEVRTRRPPSIQIRRTAAPAARTASTASTAATTAAARTKARTARAAPTARASSPPSSPAGSPTPDNEANEDHTIRPVHSAYDNARFLISTTESEMARLEADLVRKTAELATIHKGYNRRTWERLHKEVTALEKAVHDKAQIIYRQYDLLEGVRRKK